jgi:hypothetical protein
MPAKKPKKLTTFLQKICTHPPTAALYRKDPEACMKKSGLTPAHRRLVKGKDPRKLGKAVIAEHEAAGEAEMVCVVICIEAALS